MKIKTLLLAIIVFTSCKSKPIDNKIISREEMLRIVTAADNQFSIGVQKKDAIILANIYSDSAQYVQPNRAILKGKSEIGKDWGEFVKIAQNPVDLVLNINEVRGNREIIYETGEGYTLLADSTRWKFNYVNVWRLQNDGSYKLEIDTYTPLDK